ncbi:ankyrin repeat domain-containing protein [Vibrio sp. PP-XX7]
MQAFCALKDGQMDQVETLIKEGGDIHRVTESERWTYLHKMFTSPSISPEERTPPESIQFLIDQGLDVNAVDSYGNTPLLYAVRQRNVDGMRLLLANGADRMIEHQNLDGISALRMVFDRMPIEYDVTQTLLEYGANPNENDHGCSVQELVHSIVGVDAKVIELIDQYASES